MPYTAQHKQETHNRILRSARRLFNRKGFAEVSIDEIMAGADLSAFLNLTRSLKAACHVARRFTRHLFDLPMHGRPMLGWINFVAREHLGAP